MEKKQGAGLNAEGGGRPVRQVIGTVLILIVIAHVVALAAYLTYKALFNPQRDREKVINPGAYSQPRSPEERPVPAQGDETAAPKRP